MIKWPEFVASITHAEHILVISDFEQFQQDGFIGDCVLRGKAQEWHDALGVSGLSIVMTMWNLAMESYKYFAHKYIDAQEKS